jgi:purine-nucleoside phosphorylase
MSVHIGAKRNDIAETIFITWNPFKGAKWIANIFLKT